MDGLITHHADSGLSFKLPKDDIYTVSIADIQGKSGEEYSYRLRISEPIPILISILYCNVNIHVVEADTLEFMY